MEWSNVNVICNLELATFRPLQSFLRSFPSVEPEIFWELTNSGKKSIGIGSEKQISAFCDIGATFAEWIRLRLPSCSPMFESRAQHLGILFSIHTYNSNWYLMHVVGLWLEHRQTKRSLSVDSRPDIGVTNWPNFSISCPKAKAVFIFKLYCFKKDPKTIKHFGYFCKKFYCEDLSRFAQSCHTGLAQILALKLWHRDVLVSSSGCIYSTTSNQQSDIEQMNFSIL